MTWIPVSPATTGPSTISTVRSRCGLSPTASTARWFGTPASSTPRLGRPAPATTDPLPVRKTERSRAGTCSSSTEFSTRRRPGRPRVTSASWTTPATSMATVPVTLPGSLRTSRSTPTHTNSGGGCTTVSATIGSTLRRGPRATCSSFTRLNASRLLRESARLFFILLIRCKTL
ncbi:MAG: hypothetical protein AB201_01930 [Parcubacteria bacterium C7867-006]|nr:MAG: hypothetical protein AB201_01930 [Parcubacteria bacterium C7867-006]